MVLLNASARARNSTLTKNQCQGGGDKKAGLITRQIPSSVSLAYSPHYRSKTNILFMMPHQRNVTNGVGIGRRVEGIRISAWNTNGTSANICTINDSAAAVEAANDEVLESLLSLSRSLLISASSVDFIFAMGGLPTENSYIAIKNTATTIVSKIRTLTTLYKTPILENSLTAEYETYMAATAMSALFNPGNPGMEPSQAATTNASNASIRAFNAISTLRNSIIAASIE